MKVDALPSSFTYVKNFLVSFQTLKPPKLPPTPFPTTPDNNYRTGVSSEVKWLATANTSDVYTSWVQYHSKNIHYTRKPDISVILPLIDSHVHTLDTQYHCMEIAKKTTQLLNPLQITCGGCDQPVFKITKDLQWRFPELFGQDKYFCIFGSLHIEKSILILCSSLIEGSGLNKIMNSCGLSIVGTDSLVTVNHDESGDKEPVMEWLKDQCDKSEMCHYWYLILDLMLNLLIFVRSIREGNFSLYVSSLKQVVKWYFALGHYHYARWVTVHLYDLINLPSTSPYLYKCFSDGYFAFQKTNRKFSLMGIDQAHEQNNVVIKGMGGATSVLNKDDESGLARWELCLSCLCSLTNTKAPPRKKRNLSP